MVSRAAAVLALLGVGAVVAASGCASHGPSALTVVAPGKVTVVSGPGGTLVFGPESVDRSVHVTMLPVDPAGIALGDGCGLRNPVIRGALRFEVVEHVAVREVQARADVAGGSPGDLLYVYYEPPQGGGYVNAGSYAVVSADGRAAEFSEVDAEGTWLFVQPGG